MKPFNVLIVHNWGVKWADILQKVDREMWKLLDVDQVDYYRRESFGDLVSIVYIHSVSMPSHRTFPPVHLYVKIEKIIQDAIDEVIN